MLGIVAVVALIGATAVFVAAEFAFIAVDRNQVEYDAEQGGKRARALRSVLERLSFHLSAVQLGITVTSVLLGFVAEPTIAPWFHPLISSLGVDDSHVTTEISVAASLVAATFVSMLLGELVPKNLSISTPYKTALALGWLIRGYGIAFMPIVKILNGTANRLVRLLGIEPQEELANVRTLDELELVVRSAGEEGVLQGESVGRLHRTFRFGNRDVADVIVPRNEVIGLPATATVADVVSEAAHTGHSRFPVYREDLDDVFGVVHVKDVFSIPKAERSTTSISALVHDIPAVPETVSLSAALAQLQGGSHLALVIDEHGGTTGIVSLDDLLADLVGDIHDEYDTDEDLDVGLAKTGGRVQVPTEIAAWEHVDDVADEIGLRLPKGPYDTLAGFVLAKTGELPEVGTKVEYDGWTIEVTEREPLRVTRVLVTPPIATEPAEEP